MNRLCAALAPAAAALALLPGHPARGATPFADVHLHYNWNQQEVTEARAAADTLRAHDVVLGVVSSVPSEKALELQDAADNVLALFSPYVDPLNRGSWFGDPRVLPAARAALESGRYAGLGEMHIGPGIAPASSEVFRGLLRLAAEYKVPVLLHTEASDHRYFAPICREFSQVRFLWAHAGNLGPEQVGRLMETCPNVWVEFSARDPAHYGNFVGQDGRLPEAWARLIARYPRRFMTGTDPVWNAHQMFRWYEAGEGWQHYGEFIGFHRRWLAQLSPELEARLRLHNARDFFRAAGGGADSSATD